MGAQFCEEGGVRSVAPADGWLPFLFGESFEQAEKLAHGYRPRASGRRAQAEHIKGDGREGEGIYEKTCDRDCQFPQRT